MEELVLVSPKAKPTKKAQHIIPALLPDLDSFKYYLVAFSGGKDSQMAANLAIERFEKDRIKIVFCEVDTEPDGIWEFKENIEHVQYLEQVWGIKIDIVPAINPTYSKRADIDNPEKGLTSIVLQHGFMPGATMPFCTKSKRVAMEQWAEQFPANESCWIWGQRAEESASRAKLPEYGLDTETKRFVWRPVHKWTTSQVFEGIKERGQLVNPVYFQSAWPDSGQRGDNQGRANCKFCINSPNYELRKAVRRWPTSAQKFVEKIENVVGPRRDYSVSQALVDVAAEDATPNMFREQDLEERMLVEMNPDRYVCGTSNSWFRCGE